MDANTSKLWWSVFSGLSAALVVASLLALWAYAVGKGREARWWRFAVKLPFIVWALQAAGSVATFVLLTKAFDSIGALDPAHRQAALSAGLRRAMMPGVLVMVAWAGYVVVLVSNVVGLVARRSAPPAPGA